MAGVLVALVAAGAGAAYVVRGGADLPVDPRPVVLPDTFAGWGPTEPIGQFADIDSQWRDSLAEEYGGHPFHGRAYGTRADRVRIHLVVSRGDFPDVGDAGTMRPPFTSYGEVSCTSTFQFRESDLEPDPQPFTSPRWFLCLRHDEVATVSAFAVMGAQGREADLAAAIDQVWALQQ